MNLRSNQRIDYLVRLGLVSEPEKLLWYRKVFQSPKQAVKEFNLRPYVGETLEGLVDLIFNDDLLYNRIRTLLSRKKMKTLPNNMTEDALRSLTEKSVEFDVPLDVLVDVYQRGFLEEGRQIGPDQNAFNRVNSFLQGGRALELDRDLLDEYFILEEEVKKATRKPIHPTIRTLNRVMRWSASNPDLKKKPKLKPKKKKK